MTYPTLVQIKSYLNPKCFEISTTKSIYYLIKDLFLLFITFFTMYLIPQTDSLIYIIIRLPLQFIAGFFLWCLFVVGHDCGHGTFSTNHIINTVFGEFVHSAILCTPYYPWKKSHSRHHSYHNHIKKDYSHFWFIREKKDKIFKYQMNRIFYTIRPIIPFFAWFIYLIGIPDGGHYILYGRLWKNESYKEIARGYVSSIISLLSLFTIQYILGDLFINFYIIPWFAYGWWLFTVTFLQHHYDDMKLYQNEWTFVSGAFETIDRDYGRLINILSHNITDGHVIHHLYSKRIPHYNLSMATKELINGLKKDKMFEIYKYKKTYNFLPYIFSYYIKEWHFCSEKKIL